MFCHNGSFIAGLRFKKLLDKLQKERQPGIVKLNTGGTGLAQECVNDRFQCRTADEIAGGD